MILRARVLLPAVSSVLLLGACASIGEGEKPAPASPSGGSDAKPAAAKTDNTAERDAQQKELDKKKFDLECKPIEARIEQLGSESSTRSAKNEIDNAEFERMQAQKELENFQQVVKPNELAEGQLSIERSQQRLKEEQQELEELKALYKSQDFADLTKELVMSRHTAAIEFATRGLALSQKSFANRRDFELPQREAGLVQKLERSERSLREAKAREEKTKLEIDLKTKKADRDVAELEKDVKKLQEKIKALDEGAKKVADASKEAQK